MAYILINNLDNSINWVGDVWDSKLNLTGVTKLEVPDSTKDLLQDLQLHQVIWNGQTIVESEDSIYTKSAECIADNQILQDRLDSGMSIKDARQGLFINSPNKPPLS